MNTLVVNFYGGPGSGKSTMTATVFAYLKWRGINCEMALEYAKELVWEESFKKMEDQLHIFGEQNHRIHRLIGKTRVVLTDAPLLNSLIFDKANDPNLRRMVLDKVSSYNNLHYLVMREKAYEVAGRVELEREAIMLDNRIHSILKENKVEFDTIGGSERYGIHVAEYVAEYIERRP